jgi:hypothetical protein
MDIVVQCPSLTGKTETVSIDKLEVKPHPVSEADIIPTVGSTIANLYFSEELALVFGRDIGERWFALQQSHLRSLQRRRSTQIQNQVRWPQISLPSVSNPPSPIHTGGGSTQVSGRWNVPTIPEPAGRQGPQTRKTQETVKNISSKITIDYDPFFVFFACRRVLADTRWSI